MLYSFFAAISLGPRLAHRTPFYYGWVILATAASTQVVRNARQA